MWPERYHPPHRHGLPPSICLSFTHSFHSFSSFIHVFQDAMFLITQQDPRHVTFLLLETVSKEPQGLVGKGGGSPPWLMDSCLYQGLKFTLTGMV